MTYLIGKHGILAIGMFLEEIRLPEHVLTFETSMSMSHDRMLLDQFP